MVIEVEIMLSYAVDLINSREAITKCSSGADVDDARGHSSLGLRTRKPSSDSNRSRHCANSRNQQRDIPRHALSLTVSSGHAKGAACSAFTTNKLADGHLIY